MSDFYGKHSFFGVAGKGMGRGFFSMGAGVGWGYIGGSIY